MTIEEVKATMASVAELIATVDDPKARHVCAVLSRMLERALLENVELRARVAFLEKENTELRAEVAMLRAEVKRLTEENVYLKRQLYGSKGEPMPPKPEVVEPAPAAEVIDEAKAAEARQLQKQARAMLREAHAQVTGKAAPKGAGLVTQELVRRRVPDGLSCICCSGAIKDMGIAHTATEIDCIPITFIQRTYLLHRGGCPCGAVNFVMPGPERGLEKTTASPRMIADCAVDKFLWHTPIHRQEAYFKMHGVDLSRSTINGWLLRGALIAEPLWRAICAANRLQDVKLCDETPVCVVKGENSKDRFLWCVLSTLAISFDITETRNQKIAARVLGQIGAATMTDGHGCYSKKTVPGRHANCLAHARRKFYDALLSFPQESFAVLTVIHDIFMVDRRAEALALDADGRLVLRKQESMVLLIELRTLLESMNPPPKSSLGKAIKYVLKRWAQLVAFMADGRIPLSNNAVESRFRDVKLGFKNFLFAQSELGADAVAIYYTLISTARLYGHDPTNYLADVLAKITGGLPATRLGELLPWNWQPPPVVCNELPPNSRDEDLSAERVLALRRLGGKVRPTPSTNRAKIGVQKTAVK